MTIWSRFGSFQVQAELVEFLWESQGHRSPYEYADSSSIHVVLLLSLFLKDCRSRDILVPDEYSVQ